MSWLSDRWGNGPSWDGLKSSVRGTGHFIKEATPYAAMGASLIPGLQGMSPFALAALTAASRGTGDLMEGNSLGDTIKDAGIMGAEQYGGSKLSEFLGNHFRGGGGGASGGAGGGEMTPGSPPPSPYLDDPTPAASPEKPGGGFGGFLDKHGGELLSAGAGITKGILESRSSDREHDLEERKIKMLEQQQAYQQQVEEEQRRHRAATLRYIVNAYGPYDSDQKVGTSQKLMSGMGY